MLAKLKQLFGAKKKAPTKKEPSKTHDYTRLYWGHTMETMKRLDKEGDHLEVFGFGLGIKQGDFIRVHMKEYGIVHFLVEIIKYQDDPYDMFFATIKKTKEFDSNEQK